MPRDESSPTDIDERRVADVIACDAIVQAATEGDPDVSRLPPDTTVDEMGRERLLLLLNMLEASTPASGVEAAEVESSHRLRIDADRVVLGRFEVIEELGSGGFGFVVRARDHLLGREVALKMPLPERLLTPRALERSMREARAVARLDHPNVVKVYDAGPLGLLGFYISSELCNGPSLRRWLNEDPGPVPHRLAARWIAALADAVQHAHDRGILHRDIKPDNVILAAPQATSGADGPPRSPESFLPRLADFGMAKLDEEGGFETRTGALMGTPQYMAPELADGRGADVGGAIDVYSLGATLYEVLTGRPPFRGESSAETLRLVRETEPLSPRSLRPGLPPDLETICLRCLRKDPGRRYPSAAVLRDDLGRFLAGRPIVGRPVSPWEHAGGFARRRPAVAALLGVVVLLSVGLLAGIFLWTSSLREKNRQLRAEIARADGQTREAETQRQVAEARREQADRLVHAGGLSRASQALDDHQAELAQEILHDIRPGSEGTDHGDFPWRYLWRKSNLEFSQLWGHQADVTSFDATTDGKLLATVDLSGKILVWDRSPRGNPDGPRISLHTTNSARPGLLRLSTDGRHLAVVSGENSEAGVDLFDVVEGRRIARLDIRPGTRLLGPAFDPREGTLRAVLVDEKGGTFTIWKADPADGSLQRQSRPIGTGTSIVALSPDGRSLVVHAVDKILLRSSDTWEVRATLAGPPTAHVGLFAFSADSSSLAAEARSGDIAEWDTRTGEEKARFVQPPGAKTIRIEVGATGSVVALLDESSRVTLFERAGGKSRILRKDVPDRRLRNHSLAFSPDESILAVSGLAHPGGIQPPELWTVDDGRLLRTFPRRDKGDAVVFHPARGEVVLIGGPTPRVWRLDPPSPVPGPAGHTAEAWAIAFSPGGKILASGSDDVGERRTIKLWDPESGRLIAGWKGHTATVSALAFSPDGKALASASLDSGVGGHPNLILWDVASNRRLAILRGQLSPVRAVGFNHDGRLLASAGDDSSVRLWDVARAREREVLRGHANRVSSLSFGPDDRLLASASYDSTVRIWDLATSETRRVLQDVGNVTAVAFSPDGSFVVSSNDAGTIKLWDPDRGSLLRSIRGDDAEIRSLVVTPDARQVVSAGKGGIIRFWDVATGQESLKLEGHRAQINALAFAPDGSALASSAHDGSIKLWRARETSR